MTKRPSRKTLIQKAIKLISVTTEEEREEVLKDIQSTIDKITKKSHKHDSSLLPE